MIINYFVFASLSSNYYYMYFEILNSLNSFYYGSLTWGRISAYFYAFMVSPLVLSPFLSLGFYYNTLFLAVIVGFCWIAAERFLGMLDTIASLTPEGCDYFSCFIYLPSEIISVLIRPIALFLRPACIFGISYVVSYWMVENAGPFFLIFLVIWNLYEVFIMSVHWYVFFMVLEFSKTS